MLANIFFKVPFEDYFPRYNVKQEQRMIKDSQMHASETPDLEGFNAPDF